MRHHLFRAAVAVLAAATVAACDGRGTTGPGAPLTQADAASLSRALFTMGAELANGGVPAGARGNKRVLANGATTFTFSFETSQPCTPSGNVGLAGAISGAADATAQAAEVQLNVAVKHNGCTVRADNGGTFKLTGDPKIDLVLSAAAGPSGLTALHLTEVGAFTWERGAGSSGRCTVDLAADLVPGTQNVRISGTFCGFAIDETVPAG